MTAATGYDAISHAIETLVSTRGNAFSECFSREAWRLLNGSFERVLSHPADMDARGAMLAGAHFAGLAIENSMLGATHACANPLSAHYDMIHGIADWTSASASLIAASISGCASARARSISG